MNSHRFLECSSREVRPGIPALLGCPLDLTCTYRAGTGDAPRRIRISSESIETYSPLLDRDLEDYSIPDLGDVLVAEKPLNQALDLIETHVAEIARQGGIPLCLGGEHTVTLPIVKALMNLHGDFMVLHLDAHADLRTSYEGSSVNHATVIRHVAGLVGPDRLIQLGIRSGTREEFSWMRRNGTPMQWEPGDEDILIQRIGGLPVYLTLDLDILDPACFPATGNPEAGGWFYRDVERFIRALESVTVIGADVVELNPSLDQNEVGAITAAKIVREILLSFCRPR
ncbi:MAG: agmatinase [Desulfomonilaceae bacterium]|nr:agmatinase [Desulfomonilaceae bacterium]